MYDFFELTTLNMAQQGLFGEILHVEGAYIHNLEEFWPYYWSNWRLNYNNEFRGDIYATHGMGPACQLLDIHRGDRMRTLVAMDTKAATGPELGRRYGLENDTVEFQNGDHTMTFIRTEKGKTIHIQHDVMNPRPYSRMYQLTGTHGYANKYPLEEYCFRPDQIKSDEVPDHENLNMHAAISAEVKEALMKKYKHPIHQELEETAKKVGGHGGMDYIMDYRLVYCLHNGLPLDMDVYDLAEWCCLAELGEIDPRIRNCVLHIDDDLNIDAMNKAAEMTIGLHDFGSFATPNPGGTTIREVKTAYWRRIPQHPLIDDGNTMGERYRTPAVESGLLCFTIVADAFARNMVRSLVNGCVQVGIGKRSVDWFAEKMTTPLREGSTGPIAPQGLTLEHIEYPEDDQLAIRAEAIRAKRTL